MTEARPKLRDLLPGQRRTLPDDEWRRRHRVLVVVLALHAAGLIPTALLRDSSVATVAYEVAAPIVAALLVGVIGAFPRRLRSLAVTFGLLASATLLIHLSGGHPIAHLHLLVLVAAVYTYQDWTTFLVAFVYVGVHHMFVGTFIPEAMFTTGAEQDDPLRWAALYALYALALSCVLIAIWRADERARERADQLDAQLNERRRRGREALEINDAVIQQLAAASYALQLGLPEQAEAAVDRALRGARNIVDELLTEGGATLDSDALLRRIAADDHALDDVSGSISDDGEVGER